MTLKKPKSFVTDEGRKFLSKAGKKGWETKKKKQGLTTKKDRQEYFRKIGRKGLDTRYSAEKSKE